MSHPEDDILLEQIESALDIIEANEDDSDVADVVNQVLPEMLNGTDAPTSDIFY